MADFPPDCRDCRGSGYDYAGYRQIDCDRCGGAGVEWCMECNVGATRARVVADYADTCSNGSDYQSQVCAACAQRLCGLIEVTT